MSIVDDIMKSINFETEVLKEQFTDLKAQLRDADMAILIYRISNGHMNTQLARAYERIEAEELRAHDMRVLGYAQALACGRDQKVWEGLCPICQATYILEAEEHLSIIDENNALLRDLQG